jgi:hypothetical protein
MISLRKRSIHIGNGSTRKTYSKAMNAVIVCHNLYVSCPPRVNVLEA